MSMIRFGIPQGSYAGARVPFRFETPGAQTKRPHRHSAAPASYALRRATSMQGNMPRKTLRLYPRLQDLGL